MDRFTYIRPATRVARMRDLQADLALADEETRKMMTRHAVRAALLEEMRREIRRARIEATYSLKGVSMPELHHEIVDHLKAKGFPPSKAWPIAVEAVAKGCLLGISSLPGKDDGKAKLGAPARAKYCKAYAEYKKNHPKGSGIGARIGRG